MDKVHKVYKDQPTVSTKDDLCRMLELRTWIGADLLWCKVDAFTARVFHCCDDVRRNCFCLNTIDSDSFERLTSIFNDYDNFKPRNRLIKHQFVGGGWVPIVPFGSECVELTSLVAISHDLNPANISRKFIVRGKDWFVQNWRMLNVMIEVVIADFMRLLFSRFMLNIISSNFMPSFFSDWDQLLNVVRFRTVSDGFAVQLESIVDIQRSSHMLSEC